MVFGGSLDFHPDPGPPLAQRNHRKAAASCSCTLRKARTTLQLPCGCVVTEQQGSCSIVPCLAQYHPYKATVLLPVMLCDIVAISNVHSTAVWYNIIIIIIISLTLYHSDAGGQHMRKELHYRRKEDLQRCSLTCHQPLGKRCTHHSCVGARTWSCTV